MKFSSVAVLAVVAPLAAGFAPTSNQRHFSAKNVAFVQRSVRSPTTSRGAMSMELSDLEKKLFESTEEKSKPKPKAAPAPKKAEPKKKPEPTKPAPEPKKPKAKKEEPAPKPAPAPAPATAKKAKYDLDGVEGTPKPKKEKPAPKPKLEKPKAEKPTPAPRVKKGKPAPKPVVPKAPVTKDPNAVPAGVALGAAPLILAPIALFGAGRGVLTGTKARREKIQAEIAAFEAANKKKSVTADVDAGGVATALVGFPEFFNLFTSSSFRVLTLCFLNYRDFWEPLSRRWP